AQRLDELALRHLRAAGDLSVARPLLELRFRHTRQIVTRAVSRGMLRGGPAVAAGCLDARSKRLEQIGWRRFFALGSTMDLLAGSLAANDLAKCVRVRVLVLLRLEAGGEVVDQLLCHRQLFVRNGRPPR